MRVKGECDLEAIGTPFIFKLIRKTTAFDKDVVHFGQK